MTFGQSIRSEWLLEPGLVYLNHGTVGVTPRSVLEAQAEIRREIESNPACHLLRNITPLTGSDSSPGRLRAAAGVAAGLFKARPEDVVFVDNATTGVCAFLQSVGLGEGDQVVITETTYGGVRQAVRYACRRAGAEVVSAQLPCPVAGPQQVIDALAGALPAGAKLAILDHIVSETGVVLPIASLVQLCHERGLRVLVDAAHAPGQLALDVPSYGADAYVGNLHKWAFAPRSCALLWVAPELQPQIHPTVVSWNLDQGFAAEFEWTGTRDPSAFLSVPAGLEFLDRLGFEAVREYNHTLLWQGVEMLTERWETRPIAPQEMSAFMIAIGMPPRFEVSRAKAEDLRDRLLFDHGIEVPVFELCGRLWIRLSVQVYNELGDFERLAAAVEALS